MLTYLDVHYTGRKVTLAPCPVPAGFPSPAGDDQEEVVDFVSWIVRHEASTFWWRVSGDSLSSIGILDGDWVAIDRTGKARPGRVVLAVHEGEVLIKVLEKRDGQLVLEARSFREYPPIMVGEDTTIWGVMAGLARKMAIE